MAWARLRTCVLVAVVCVGIMCGMTPARAQGAGNAHVGLLRAASVGEYDNPAAGIGWYRIAGEDRYATMGALVSESFADGSSPWAVIASGEDYHDALAASPLAGALECPLLINGHDALSDHAATQISRLGVRNVLVVGNEDAIGTQVEADLRGQGVGVTRVTGASHAAVSAAVARELDDLRGSGTVQRESDTVIVATGSTFADSLSISPWAYASASPILFTDADGLLSNDAVEVVRSGGFSRALLVGGVASVPDQVRAQLEAAGGLTVMRLDGATRYDTSRAIAEWEVAQGAFGWDATCVATGRTYPDALTGAAYCAKSHAPLLLVDELDGPTWDLLNLMAPTVAVGHILGGAQSVPLLWSGDAGLDAMVDEIVSGTTGTGYAGLRNAYELVSGYPYVSGDTFPEGEWLTWSIPAAVSMHANNGGNCYGYASLFTWVARRLGYNARAVSGLTVSASAGLVAHGWTEVYHDGVAYTCDCERHHAMPEHDFFMVTYDESPLYYYGLDEVQIV